MDPLYWIISSLGTILRKILPLYLVELLAPPVSLGLIRARGYSWRALRASFVIICARALIGGEDLPANGQWIIGTCTALHEPVLPLLVPLDHT